MVQTVSLFVLNPLQLHWVLRAFNFLPADLTRLETFRLQGAGLIGEERPGLLADLCRNLTYLLLHGEKLSSSEPISSPSLKFLSIICPQTHKLPGAYPYPCSCAFAGHLCEIHLQQGLWFLTSLPARAVGSCPELLTLIHSARDVAAADLLRLPKLTTLRDTICAPAHISQTFVMGLQPLSCLQHIQLSQ